MRLRKLDTVLRQIGSFMNGFVLPRAEQIALLILGMVLVFELYFWFKTDGMPNIQDQSEAFTSYMAARNLERYGLLDLHLLEDYATGSSPEAHPYYYTHNQDFPFYYSYILLKLGIDSISYQNLTAILILLIGLWYMYKATSIVANPAAGLAVLAVGATDYLGTLAFGLNLHRSWTWLVFFGALYHLLAGHKASGVKRKLHFGTSMAFLFATTYFDYQIAILLILSVLLLRVFRVYERSWKTTFVFALAPAVLAWSVHAAIVVWAVGPEVFLKDLRYTITNRILGTPSRESLENFYSEHSLVLWGYPNLTPDLIKDYIGIFRERVDSLFGRFALYLGFLWLVSTLAYLIYRLSQQLPRRWLLGVYLTCSTRVSIPVWLRRTVGVILLPFRIIRRLATDAGELWQTGGPELSSAARFLMAILIATLVTCVLLPQHTFLVFVGPFLPFFVLFLSVMLGITLWALFKIGFTSLSRRYQYIYSFCLVVIAIILTTSIVEARWQNYQDNPPNSFGSATVLDKYRGYPTITTYIASYVNYFTEEWVNLAGWHGEPLQAPFDSKYLFERDRVDNPDKYQYPAYIVLQAAHHQPLPDTSLIRDDFQVVEAGDDYVILRVEGGSKQEYIALDLKPVALQVSSVNLPNQGKNNLIDGDPDSFWHVEIPKTWDEDWIIFNLENAENIRALALKPRKGYLDQLWEDDHAEFQASNDGVRWVNLGKLYIDKSKLENVNPGWTYFYFNNPKEFRYYRILIKDRQFLSLAEIELFRSRNKDIFKISNSPSFDPQLFAKVGLSASDIDVSSFNLTTQGKENLVDCDPDTYWHVAQPKTGTEDWVIADLSQPERVEGIAIIPRRGFANQLWTGKNARIQGSNDRNNWDDISKLELKRDEINDAIPNRVHLNFKNEKNFRYYRILIEDHQFLSLAELELYKRVTSVVTTALPSSYISLKDYSCIDSTSITLEVSSFNGNNERKENLVDGNADTYWHVHAPKEANQEDWLAIDLRRPESIQGLGIKPRRGYIDQLWSGQCALLEGSVDEETPWQLISALEMDNSSMDNSEPPFVYYTFDNKNQFRYYRLRFKDESFFSLSELLLYKKIHPILKPLDPAMYTKINLTATALEVSSSNKEFERKENLIDNNPDTYWHVQVPKETGRKDWVIIDLGQSYSVQALAIMPRKGFSEQLWKTGGATLQGSQDKEQWEDISKLNFDYEAAVDANPDLLYVSFENTKKFRYYRILIQDPSFASLAELELYTGNLTRSEKTPDHLNSLDPNKYTKIRLSPAQLEVSSFNKDSEGKQYLIDDNPDTYWHVKHPKMWAEDWVLIDLRSSENIQGLAVKPRKGFLDQFWNIGNAKFQVRDDKEQWHTLLELGINKDILNETDPPLIYYTFDNPYMSRYYRLLIQDPEFLSLAELELYRSESANGTNIPQVLWSFDSTQYRKISFSADSLMLSTNNSPNDKNNLVDGNPDTFWEVRQPKLWDEDWLIVDLGETKRVTALRLMPRKGHVNQLWQGANAVIEGNLGDRASSWQRLAELHIDKAVPDYADPQWLSFSFENPSKYRYYRIRIFDQKFRSLAELELYGPKFEQSSAQPLRSLDATQYNRIELSSATIEVSSASTPYEDAVNLVDGDLSTYCQIKQPASSNEAWLIIDMGLAKRINGLAIMPKEQHVNQLWESNQAVLQSSNDKKTWSMIAQLEIDETSPDNAEQRWLYFTFDNANMFRYYRILIRDTRFISLAELELYELREQREPYNLALQTDFLEPIRYDKIALSPTMLNFSSEREPGLGKFYLIDGNPATSWQVKQPKWSDEHWVSIDLGKPERVEAIRIKTANEQGAKPQKGDIALFQGSPDGTTWWLTISTIELGKSTINSIEPPWFNFNFDNPRSFRYYRLLIRASNFSSFAELELYRGGPEAGALATPSTSIDPTIYKKLALDVTNLEVSNFNKDTEGKANLLDNDPETYWHVKLPKKEPREDWVLVDLVSPKLVEGLAIKPREGFTDQLWEDNNAILQAMDNSGRWIGITRLKMNKAEVDKVNAPWIYYTFENNYESRYYRIIVSDPTFLSLAELEFYESKATVISHLR